MAGIDRPECGSFVAVELDLFHSVRGVVAETCEDSFTVVNQLGRIKVKYGTFQKLTVILSTLDVKSFAVCVDEMEKLYPGWRPK